MKVVKVWFEDDKIFIQTDQGETVWQSLLWYPRLKLATQEQRKHYRINAFGIHWEDIDEDLSFESFEYEDRTPSGEVANLFRAHPELNVSAVCRRLGISQTLMAAYIKGSKKPSIERKQQIIETLHQIGAELSAI